MDVPVWLQIASDIGEAIAGLSVITAVIIYVWQKDFATKSEKQANRSRLTEAYMNVNAYVLSNDETIDVANALFNRGIEALDTTRNSRETTIAIEIFHLKLNALFLEWNYRKTYPENSTNLRAEIYYKLKNFLNRNAVNPQGTLVTAPDEFEKTFNGTMKGFAFNDDPNSQKIIANLREIFPGFPDEFMNLMDLYFFQLNSKIRVRENLNLQNLGDTTKGIEWLKNGENTKNARHVYNTVFYRYSEDDVLTESAKAKIPDVAIAVKALLDAKCTWEDIYIESQADTLREMAIRFTPAQRSHYRSWQIKPEAVSAEFPLLQVLLIKYHSGASIVLFGWIFRGVQSDKVYISSGPETTDYFMDYINKLKRNSDPVFFWDTVNTGNPPPRIRH